MPGIPISENSHRCRAEGLGFKEGPKALLGIHQTGGRA